MRHDTLTGKVEHDLPLSGNYLVDRGLQSQRTPKEAIEAGQEVLKQQQRIAELEAENKDLHQQVEIQCQIRYCETECKEIATDELKRQRDWLVSRKAIMCVHGTSFEQQIASIDEVLEKLGKIPPTPTK